MGADVADALLDPVLAQERRQLGPDDAAVLAVYQAGSGIGVEPAGDVAHGEGQLDLEGVEAVVDEFLEG